MIVSNFALLNADGDALMVGKVPDDGILRAGSVELPEAFPQGSTQVSLPADMVRELDKAVWPLGFPLGDFGGGPLFFQVDDHEMVEVDGVLGVLAPPSPVEPSVAVDNGGDGLAGVPSVAVDELVLDEPVLFPATEGRDQE